MKNTSHVKSYSKCAAKTVLLINYEIVFREGAASLDSLMDTPHQTRIIEHLIINVQVSELTVLNHDG